MIAGNGVKMSEFAKGIVDILGRIPPREALLYVAVGFLLYRYLKVCNSTMDRLQKENERLIEEKKVLLKRLGLSPPTSGLNHYPAKKGVKKK